MIKVGDSIPEATLYEFNQVPSEKCPVGPTPVNTVEASKGKKIAVLGLPGAFTPTCSVNHLPGFISSHQLFTDKGVNEIWCVSVNDAFVMGEWGRQQKALGKVRMLGDGSAELTKKIGLEFDLTTKGLGIRSQRYSLLLDNGVVKILNVEAPGKFEVSNSETLLKQL